MAKSIDLLPLGTIESSGDSDVVQDIPDSLDTSGHTSGFAEIHVIGTSGAPASPTLLLEGSDDGQSFVELMSEDSDGRATATLDRTKPMGDSSRLYRILRWRIHPLDDDWYICGRIHAILK